MDAALNKNVKHDIEVVVDRVVVREDIASRLADSFETALGLADGIALTENADPGPKGGEQTIFSAKFACPVMEKTSINHSNVPDAWLISLSLPS